MFMGDASQIDKIKFRYSTQHMLRILFRLRILFVEPLGRIFRGIKIEHLFLRNGKFGEKCRLRKPLFIE